MADTNIGTLRNASGFMRTIATVVLVTFTTVTVSPGVQAMEQTITQAYAERNSVESRATAISRLTAQLRGVLNKDPNLLTTDKSRAVFVDFRAELQDLDAKVFDDFEAIEAGLRSKSLPDEILQRHQAAVAAYRAESEGLQQELSQLAGGADEKTARKRIDALKRRLEQLPGAAAKRSFSPNSLPYQALRKLPRRAPRLKAEEFAELLPIELEGGPRLASLSPLPLILAAQAGTIGAEFTAATEDAQITPGVRNLATQLGNDPVKIYNWVRNNVDYVPTHGSIQGSQLTLHKKSGNAADVSSLLIALLRAAAIPARYAYGTIDVPIDRAMNWLGVSTPDDAQDLLGQGGVPVLAVTSSGRITKLRLEHIWVEAWIDFVPSRGAVHRTGDTWVPMDASFKQYEVTAATDVEGQVPFDVSAALSQFQQAATLDPAVGTIASVNLGLVRQLAASYQAQLRTHLEATQPEFTSINMLGWRSIVQQEPQVLAASLANRVLTVGARFAVIPANLRHRVNLSLYASSLDQTLESPQATAQVSLPRLGLSRLSVHYRPASAADQQVIQSAIDGGATSLPAYLIRVVPEIKLDDESLAEGPVTTMGAAQFWTAELRGPGAAAGPVNFPDGIAGDELVFAINGGGVDSHGIIARMLTAPAQSAAEDLHLAGLTYWAAHDRFDYLAASATGVRSLRLPSAAIVKAGLVPRYFLGIARQASYSGRQLDARRVSVAAVGPSADAVRAFLILSGTQGSQWEASSFNVLFDRSQGVSLSATEYLTYAALRGVPIHTVTAQNLNAVLPLLQVSEQVRTDIVNAAQAGYTAIVPQRDLNVLGQSGIGYIILDPQTGAGAYLVEGGLNGGKEPGCGEQVTPPSSGPGPGSLLAFTGLIPVSERAASAALASELEKFGARAAGQAALQRLLPAITARIIGSAITIQIAPLLLNPAAAVAISLAIIMLMHLVQYALIEEGYEVGDLTREATDEQAAEQCTEEEEPQQCSERIGPLTGGDPVHQACQSQPSHTSIPGNEWVVTHPNPSFIPPQKSFDTIQGRTVCEVKTDNCRGGTKGTCGAPFLQDIMLADLSSQRKLAYACGLSFCAIVGDPDLARIIESWGFATVLDTSGQCLQP